MKTTYQKLADYGVNTWMFGKAKKKGFAVFWLLIATIIMMGLFL